LSDAEVFYYGTIDLLLEDNNIITPVLIEYKNSPVIVLRRTTFHDNFWVVTMPQNFTNFCIPYDLLDKSFMSSASRMLALSGGYKELEPPWNVNGSDSLFRSPLTALGPISVTAFTCDGQICSLEAFSAKSAYPNCATVVSDLRSVYKTFNRLPAEATARMREFPNSVTQYFSKEDAQHAEKISHTIFDYYVGKEKNTFENLKYYWSTIKDSFTFSFGTAFITNIYDIIMKKNTSKFSAELSHDLLTAIIILAMLDEDQGLLSPLFYFAFKLPSYVNILSRAHADMLSLSIMTSLSLYQNPSQLLFSLPCSLVGTWGGRKAANLVGTGISKISSSLYSFWNREPTKPIPDSPTEEAAAAMSLK